MAKRGGEEAERLGLERLYHRVCADEEVGIQLFQEMAEGLTRYRLVNRLRALLNDANTYPLERLNSRLWREYYGAKLIHLAGEPSEAEKVYRRIAENKQTENKLQAYAWHDMGTTLRGRRIGSLSFLAEATACFERSLSIGVLDYKLAAGLLELMGIYRDKGDWDKALEVLNRGLEYYRERNSLYDLAIVYNRFRWYYIYRGDWRRMFAAEKQGLELAHQIGNPLFLQRELSVPPAAIWTGRYFATEQSIRQVIQWDTDLGIFWTIGNLALAVGLCDKFDEAILYITQNQETMRQQRGYSERGEAVGLGWYGIILVRMGEPEKGQRKCYWRVLRKKEELKIPHTCLKLCPGWESRTRF